jgi:hypothetical protein
VSAAQICWKKHTQKYKTVLVFGTGTGNRECAAMLAVAMYVSLFGVLLGNKLKIILLQLNLRLL